MFIETESGTPEETDRDHDSSVTSEDSLDQADPETVRYLDLLMYMSLSSAPRSLSSSESSADLDPSGPLTD